MAVWIGRVTQYANHFPVGNVFIRDSSAKAVVKVPKGSKKRAGPDTAQDSALACQVQAKRVCLCPRIEAVRGRLAAKPIDASPLTDFGISYH